VGLHDGGLVIHMPQQHRLVAQRYPRIRQPPEGVANFRRQLPGMVGMDADEQGV